MWLVSCSEFLSDFCILPLWCGSCHLTFPFLSHCTSDSWHLESFPPPSSSLLGASWECVDLAQPPSDSAPCCGSLSLTLKCFCSSACRKLAPLVPWAPFPAYFHSVKWEWPACREGLHCRFLLLSPEHFTLWNVFCSVCHSLGKTVTSEEKESLLSLLLSPESFWLGVTCSVFCSVPMTGGHDSTYLISQTQDYSDNRIQSLHAKSVSSLDSYSQLFLLLLYLVSFSVGAVCGGRCQGIC